MRSPKRTLRHFGVLVCESSGSTFSESKAETWGGIVDEVSEAGSEQDVFLTPESLASDWKKQCVSNGIGSGILGWLFIWKWAFPLLLELACLWIDYLRKEKERSNA